MSLGSKQSKSAVESDRKKWTHNFTTTRKHRPNIPEIKKTFMR